MEQEGGGNGGGDKKKKIRTARAKGRRVSNDFTSTRDAPLNAPLLDMRNQ